MQILFLIGLYFLKCTKFDQLILMKITKIVATRCQILTLKCTKIDFDWGSAPDPLAGFKEPTSKGRGGEGREGDGRGGEGRERGRKGRGRSTCLPPRFDNPGYGPVSSKCRSLGASGHNLCRHLVVCTYRQSHLPTLATVV